MKKEERQKELRERLLPEIKFVLADSAVCIALPTGVVKPAVLVVGHLGKLHASTFCVRDDSKGEQASRGFVSDGLMRQVFKKEGCL